MLETFVFVSGFVFGYQVRVKGESKLGFKHLFLNKFRRLMMPSIVFSFLYILLLQDIHQPITKTMYEIIKGVAHMWFLPMLFWCFIFVCLIERTRISFKLAFSSAMLFCLLPIPSLPFQLYHVFYYFPFFYVGYFIQKKDISLKLNRLYKTQVVAMLVVAFLILFPSLTLLREWAESQMGGGKSDLTKLFTMTAVKRFSQLIYSLTGLIMMLATVGTYLKKHTKPIPQWIRKTGDLCMGVYLLQQFLLIILYRHTELPILINPYLLPWIGTLATIVISILLSSLIRRTSIGRSLIG